MQNNGVSGIQQRVARTLHIRLGNMWGKKSGIPKDVAVLESQHRIMPFILGRLPGSPDSSFLLKNKVWSR